MCRAESRETCMYVPGWNVGWWGRSVESIQRVEKHEAGWTLRRAMPPPQVGGCPEHQMTGRCKYVITYSSITHPPPPPPPPPPHPTSLAFGALVPICLRLFWQIL